MEAKGDRDHHPELAKRGSGGCRTARSAGSRCFVRLTQTEPSWQPGDLLSPAPGGQGAQSSVGARGCFEASWQPASLIQHIQTAPCGLTEPASPRPQPCWPQEGSSAPLPHRLHISKSRLCQLTTPISFSPSQLLPITPPHTHKAAPRLTAQPFPGCCPLLIHVSPPTSSPPRGLLIHITPFFN